MLGPPYEYEGFIQEALNQRPDVKDEDATSLTLPTTVDADAAAGEAGNGN